MRRLHSVVLLSALASGCYTGASATVPQTGADPDASTGGQSGEDGESGDGSDTGDTSSPAEEEPPRLWRLSASQYERTVEAALGVEVVLPRIQFNGRSEDFTNYANASGVDEVFFANLEEDLFALITDNVDAVAAPLSCSLESLDVVCLEAYLGPFVQRAHRTETTDLAPFVELYEDLAPSQGASAAFASVLVAVLLSPKAFFRTELGADDDNPAAPMTPFELAENLSYMVWNGPPDEALFAAARDGSLADPEVFTTHLDRMLDAPQGNEGMVEFLSQWLGLTGLAGMSKDPVAFPEFDEELVGAMMRETQDLFEFVLDEPGADLRTLLTTQKSFADAPLAALYGVEPLADGSVELPADQRRGVFTTAGVIVAMSDASSTAVIYRGKALLNRMLCRDLPPRPAGVEPTPPPGIPEDATTREKLESIEEQVPCNTCHIDMHPFSFAMEQYDAVGRFRQTQNGHTIDPSGALFIQSSGELLPFDDVRGLIDQLAQEPDVYDCLVLQGVRYTTGNRVQVLGEEDLERISAQFRESRNIRELFRELVITVAFRGRAKAQDNECFSP